MQSLSTIPNLKRLNLSRNKFKAFHSDLLTLNPNGWQEAQASGVNTEESQKGCFLQLEELNMSFNVIEDQSKLFYCATNMPMLRTLTVTGNPFAITEEE